jgi:hypothetical protein
MDFEKARRERGLQATPAAARAPSGLAAAVAVLVLVSCPRHGTPGASSGQVSSRSSAFAAASAAAEARAPDPARGGPPLNPGQSPLPPFLGVSRASSTYVGPEACAACHAATYAGWARTNHRSSLDSLATANSDHDPGCLRCHVTGLGHPGGMPGHPAKGMAAVGCEACHGPGGDHVTSPNADYGALPRDASACVACHTVDTSPDFNWAEYWPKLKHERPEPSD